MGPAIHDGSGRQHRCRLQPGAARRWNLGAGSWHLSLEPFSSGSKTDFHVTLTKFSRAGLDVHQIRDASIHLSEPPQFEPVESHATKTTDASQLTSVPTAVPFGAIISGPRGEWVSTLYYMTRRDQRYRRLVLIRSFDHGHTWNEDGTIAALKPDEKPWPWMGNEGPNEAGTGSTVRQPIVLHFSDG